MSGNSGGSGRTNVGTGRPSGSGGGDDCSRVYKDVRLSSPKDLAKLVLRDVLDVVVRDKSGTPVIHVMKAGEDMGTIISRALGKLIECDKKGYKYLAKVTKLDGGECLLEIKLKGSA
jgi:hypothetical protein